jgi:hypothetical protein
MSARCPSGYPSPPAEVCARNSVCLFIQRQVGRGPTRLKGDFAITVPDYLATMEADAVVI